MTPLAERRHFSRFTHEETEAPLHLTAGRWEATTRDLASPLGQGERDCPVLEVTAEKGVGRGGVQQTPGMAREQVRSEGTLRGALCQSQSERSPGPEGRLVWAWPNPLYLFVHHQM